MVKCIASAVNNVQSIFALPSPLSSTLVIRGCSRPSVYWRPSEPKPSWTWRRWHGIRRKPCLTPSPLWTSYRNGYKSFLWDFCWYFLKYLLISPAFWFKCVFDHLLSSQMEMGLPRPQRVVQLPDIAWDQYTSGRGDFEREFCDKKCKTRQLQLIFDKGVYLLMCVYFCIMPSGPID